MLLFICDGGTIKSFFFCLKTNYFDLYSPIANIIRVSQNAIDILNVEKREATDGPIILSCMTNLERSCYVLLTVTCVLALESEAPVIISKCCDRIR